MTTPIVPLHALELLPDEAGDALVRSRWAALADAGLPSLATHPSPTNAPHVTVVAVPALTADDEARAVALLVPLLPITARLDGLAALGGDPASLVMLAQVDDAVVRAVLDLRASVEGHLFPGWLAHVSLALRMRRAQWSEAAAVLGSSDPEPVELSLTTLRRWDPDQHETRVLTPPR